MILDRSALLFSVLRSLVSTIVVRKSSKEASHTSIWGWVNLTATRCKAAENRSSASKPYEREIEGGGRRTPTCDRERPAPGGIRLSGFAFGVAFSA